MMGCRGACARVATEAGEKLGKMMPSCRLALKQGGMGARGLLVGSCGGAVRAGYVTIEE